jgi:polyphosphate:AMP phosphotransferase
MFETAEIGQRVSKQEYREREPALRQQLLEAQTALREADFPVIVLFAGVDGAGKGETANLLNEWMDTRGIVTRAFDSPTTEESERPLFWRFWRALPPKRRIGVFLSAWYSNPLLSRVHGEIDDETFDDQLDEIKSFERTLADEGALILKFWMHLGKSAQKKRFKDLEKDPLQSWRVTKKDWSHWKRYGDFVSTAERLIMRTSTGHAPWMIVEGADQRYRSLRVGSALLDAMNRRLAEHKAMAAVHEVNGEDTAVESNAAPSFTAPTSILSSLKMDRELDKKKYRSRVNELQGRLNLLHRRARDEKVSTILVFEGWDAAGKGGAIRRITPALDARDYQVISIAAPTDEEREQHYLWRFWRQLPRAGKFTIFDRSWYGRVLVERVEGFATEREWRRSYAEINDFEQRLVEHGSALVKFWIHITPEVQEQRFKARLEIPHKRWKITEEDWRNREKWDQYELAVNTMIERTSTRTAPWVLVEGNDKRTARVKILEAVCDRLERSLGKKATE